WRPRITSGGDPATQVAVVGNNVLLGGGFDHIDGMPRHQLARLDARTGALDERWNPMANGGVSAVTPSGSEVLAGGDCTGMGGIEQPHLAAIDAATGRLDAAFRPQVLFPENDYEGGEEPQVRGLAIADGRVYVAGDVEA